MEIFKFKKNVRRETTHSVEGLEYKVKEISETSTKRVTDNKGENTRKIRE